MKTSILFLSVITLTILCCTQDMHVNSEEEAIKKVIINAYIEGLFNKGDASLAREGFHTDCNALILRQDQLLKISANSYVERFETNPGPLHAGTEYVFTDVHVTGTAAMAIVEIYQESNHIYTDYISLYKFSTGWKIVTKIFYSYPREEIS